MDGVLVIDKPSGKSSFDVIRDLRRKLGTRKMGHLGTLDPLATGVLVVFVGKATSLIRYFDDLDKVYEATLEFGKTSDTYDSTGEVTITGTDAPDQEILETALQSFLGSQWQIQPAFSALKIDGKRAYERARAGETLKLGKRQVVIHELELLEYEAPTARIRVNCSNGTYVRSLIHELGEKLGCGAIMTGLRRLTVGPFSLADDRLEPEELIRDYIDWKGKAAGDRDLLIRQFNHSSTPDSR